MSGAHLSFIWYSSMYLVQGLVITLWRLIVMDTNVCVTLSRQVCHSMTSLPSLKTSNQFTIFSLFQHTPSGPGRADTNPLLFCLNFFDSSRLDVRPFWKSSFCAISSLTFHISEIFSPFGIPMMRFLNLKKISPLERLFHEVHHRFISMIIF